MDEIISEEIVNIEKNYEIDLWTINVIYYTTAVTVLQKEGKLRKHGRKQKQKEKSGWQIRLESHIQAIRRKLSYTHVLIECHKSKKYTKHQRNIKYKMEKQYGMITTDKLKYLKANLKQELKVESLKLRN